MRIVLTMMLVAGVLICPPPAHAVDGYKDIKFGISPSKLKAMNKCAITKDVYSSEDGTDAYECSNFKFGGKQIQAMFYFPEGRLLRIALIVGTTAEDFISLMEPLGKKYGQVDKYLSSDRSMFELYDQGTVNQIDLVWDGNTVALRMYRAGGEEVVLLLYSSPDYEKEMLRAKVKGVEDDL